MPGTWILVADRARARLFLLDAEAHGLQPVEEFSNPDGRLRPREMQTDRPPIVHDRFGHGRHAIEPGTRPEDTSALRFAAQLRDVLEAGRSMHAYRQLVLIAPPRFLGFLNGSLGRRVRAAVVLEVAKEMTGADEKRILSQLPRALAGPARSTAARA